MIQLLTSHLLENETSPTQDPKSPKKPTIAPIILRPPPPTQKAKVPTINSLHVLTTYQKIGRGMLSSTPADVAIDSINNTPNTADEVQINFYKKIHLLGIRFLLLCISFTLLLLFVGFAHLHYSVMIFVPPLS
jgi:hypothetical protein